MADDVTPTIDSAVDQSSAADSAGLDVLAAWLDARPRLQFWGSIVIIAVTAFVAYYQVLFVPLHLDERALLDAIEMQETASADRVSTLTRVDLSLDARLSGEGAFGFRFASLMFHILCGCLLFGIVWRILDARHRPPGWAVLAGLLFVAHPAGTQTVNTIMSRGTGLSVASVFASLLLFLVATDRRREEPAYAIVGVSVAFAALGWAAHPVAVVLPVLVLIVDALRGSVAPLRVHAAYWALAVSLGLMNLSGVLSVGESTLSLTGATYAGHTLRLLFAPTTLLIQYGPDAAHTSAWIWVGVALLGLVLVPISRIAAAGLLWFAAVTLGFTLLANDVPYGETLVYLALPALAIPVACGVARTSRIPASALAVLVALVVLAAVAGTATRTNQWRSEAALWIDAQEACPSCPQPNRILGRLHLQEAERLSADPAALDANPQFREDLEGHIDYAVDFLSRVNETSSATSESLLAEARALTYQGEEEAAENRLREAARRFPGEPGVLLALGDWYWQRATANEDLDAAGRAEHAYAAGIATGVASPRAVQYVARRRLARGDALGALYTIQRAAADPVPEELNRIAQSANTQRQSQQAAQQVWAQAAGDPDNATFADSIKARTLYLEGHADLTVLVASDALRRDPENLEAWYTLGLASLGRNRFGEFLERYADGPPGDDPDGAWRGLAQTFAVSGRWDAARAAVERVHPGRPLDVFLDLADVALSIQQVQQAAAILQRAAEEVPESPEPWLRLADIAIETGQSEAALGFIEQAATRGAPDVLLQPLRERARGEDDSGGLGLQRRTVVR